MLVSYLREIYTIGCPSLSICPRQRKRFFQLPLPAWISTIDSFRFSKVSVARTLFMKKPLGFSFLAAWRIALFCFQSVRRQIIKRGRIRLPSLEDRTSYMLLSNMLLAREMGALYVDFNGKLGLSFYCNVRLNFRVFPFFTKLFWNPIDSYAIPTAVFLLFLRLVFNFLAVKANLFTHLI